MPWACRLHHSSPLGTKRTRWFDVQVRVSDKFCLEMHVDTDDANAVGLGNGSTVTMVKD